MREEKEVIKRFYDSFGWQKGEDNHYRDTRLFVDFRPLVRAYEHKAHKRVRRFFRSSGRFFLDAASGAIPHPEYLEYSVGFQRRVCVDLSEQGLREARAKLGEKGHYLLADITRLPFKDGVFDSILSAHTIYHVPQDEQLNAIRELERTLARQGRCVIIYTWPSRFIDNWIERVKRFRRTVRNLKRRLKSGRSESDSATASHSSSTTAPRPEVENPPPLYSHAHEYAWFQTNLPKSWNVRLRCWSMIDQRFTKSVVPENLLGSLILKLIYVIESIAPGWAARAGRYPIFVIRK